MQNLQLNILFGFVLATKPDDDVELLIASITS